VAKYFNRSGDVTSSFEGVSVSDVEQYFTSIAGRKFALQNFSSSTLYRGESITANRRAGREAISREAFPNVAESDADYNEWEKGNLFKDLDPDSPTYGYFVDIDGNPVSKLNSMDSSYTMMKSIKGSTDEYQGEDPGICPVCGAAELDYGTEIVDKEAVDATLVYDWTCGNCGATGTEIYNMELEFPRLVGTYLMDDGEKLYDETFEDDGPGCPNPNCNEMYLDYDDTAGVKDGEYFYGFRCPTCGCEGTESVELTFVEHGGVQIEG
jgi:transcription elongation factor Elf1